MTKQPELEFVGWKEFHRLGFKLAARLAQEAGRLDTIVSISRGGHVISRVLSDFLDLPIFNMSLQSYVEFQQQEVLLIQKLGRYLVDQEVLLVDEIVDSGRSLLRAEAYLKRLRVKRVVSVALHVKPGATKRPDYFVKETDKWVVYPYEVRETIAALWPIWEELGWGEARCKRVLVAGGMSQPQVEQMYAKVKRAKELRLGEGGL